MGKWDPELPPAIPPPDDTDLRDVDWAEEAKRMAKAFMKRREAMKRLRRESMLNARKHRKQEGGSGPGRDWDRERRVRAEARALKARGTIWRRPDLKGKVGLKPGTKLGPRAPREPLVRKIGKDGRDLLEDPGRKRMPWETRERKPGPRLKATAEEARLIQEAREKNPKW